eukprot:scaffold131384_cov20-Tisochrysis_lutea.AAC.1
MGHGAMTCTESDSCFAVCPCLSDASPCNDMPNPQTCALSCAHKLVHCPPRSFLAGVTVEVIITPYCGNAAATAAAAAPPPPPPAHLGHGLDDIPVISGLGKVRVALATPLRPAHAARQGRHVTHLPALHHAPAKLRKLGRKEAHHLHHSERKEVLQSRKGAKEGGKGRAQEMVLQSRKEAKGVALPLLQDGSMDPRNKGTTLHPPFAPPHPPNIIQHHLSLGSRGSLSAHITSPGQQACSLCPQTPPHIAYTHPQGSLLPLTPIPPPAHPLFHLN